MYTLLLTVLVIILVGVTWYWREQSHLGRAEPTHSIQDQATIKVGSEEMTDAPVTVPHPVSLDALIAQEPTGQKFQVGRVLTTTDVYTRHFITYQSDGLTISGILNIPNGTPPLTGWPILFLNHGYIDPAVYTNGRGLKREQDYFARQGYAVIHSDYRNHAESDDDPENEIHFRLGYTRDIINAIEAVRNAQLSYLDAQRIGMLGHSMGGGVTLNTLVVAPELVDAAVLFAPVSANYVRNYERWTKRESETGQQIIEKYGTPEANPEFWKGVSAKNYFNRIAVPIQNHHGTADDSVELKWSDELDQWLTEAGKQHEYFIYPGEPHEFIDAWPLVMRRSLEFFDRYVKNKASN